MRYARCNVYLFMHNGCNYNEEYRLMKIISYQCKPEIYYIKL